MTNLSADILGVRGVDNTHVCRGFLHIHKKIERGHAVFVRSLVQCSISYFERQYQKFIYICIIFMVHVEKDFTEYKENI